MSLTKRLVNGGMGLAIRFGIGPANAYLLTTVGRKSGQRRTNPVSIVEQDGVRWLVSPYGVRPWVLNARAAGEVELRRGRSRQRWAVADAAATDVASVLRQYLAENKITAPYFDADEGSDDTAFIAEAARHPVLRLSEPAG